MRKTIVTSEVIVLGRQGEDGANKVLFPVRGWKELYGDGQFVVTVQRPDENDPYPVSSTLVDMFVEWIVGSADVEIPGRGKVELAYYTSDDVRVKSVVYHTVIYDALGQNSLTPPEPWQNWVDQVREAGADAIQAAEDAAGAVSDAFSQITATATTLSPGSSATASFDPSTKVMSFGIPRGHDGSGGGGGTTVETVSIADAWEYTGSNIWVNVGYSGLCNFEEVVRKCIDEGIDRVKFRYCKNDPNTSEEEINYCCDGLILSASSSSVVIDCYLIVGMTTSTNFTVEFTDNTSVVVSRQDTPLEKRGTIGIGLHNYAVQRKALTITENGVTTTYYVADITTSEV